MTSHVRVEIGQKTRRHREALQGFPCCKPHVPVAGRRMTRCIEPWSHIIETDIHADLLTRAGANRESHDYRLLLLFDGEGLVAVAGHQQIDANSRLIDLIAVHTDMRAGKLSDGQRCSEAALAMVLDDVRGRTPLVTVLKSDVDHRNLASIGFLTRVGARIGPDVVDGHRAVVFSLS